MKETCIGFFCLFFPKDDTRFFYHTPLKTIQNEFIFLFWFSGSNSSTIKSVKVACSTGTWCGGGGKGWGGSAWWLRYDCSGIFMNATCSVVVVDVAFGPDVCWCTRCWIGMVGGWVYLTETRLLIQNAPPFVYVLPRCSPPPRPPHYFRFRHWGCGCPWCQLECR